MKHFVCCIREQHKQPRISAIKSLFPCYSAEIWTTLRKHKSGKIGSKCFKYIQIFIAAYMHSGWVKIISQFGWQRKDSSCPRINLWGSHWNDEFSDISQSWTLAQVQELALEWWWGIMQFLVGITVAKKLKLMQSAAFRLYLLLITKLHIITTVFFVYLWWLNSLICMFYSRTALQTCVEVSEILRQLHEG